MHSLKRFEDMTAAEWAEHDRQIRALTQGVAAGAAIARWAAMGMPKRAIEVVASGKLSDTDARRLIHGRAVITCLSGNPGTGKTVAACEWLVRRGDGMFVKAASLPRVDRARVPKLLQMRALVLDDLGTEFLDSKGYVSSLLDELIDSRYDAKLPTVITTNLDDKVFKSRYGERLVDRIREAGRFVIIGGASMRGRP
jgi:hypothetical protein